METKELYERYQRQLILPGFGEEGQQKLLKAKILVLGAGGLGCPILQYLTAAGVGTIGIVDDAMVALNNLHRQVLYSVNDVGMSKAKRAAEILRQLNPTLDIIAFNERLTVDNTLDLFNRFDIIIDCTDNFSTRYMINDACVLLNRPLVYGAISQFEGQVSVFNFGHHSPDQAVNYRDLFPDPPKENEILNCADAGVLGVLAGVIGTLMANETIKLITGIGELLANQLITYNALNNQFYQFTLFAKEGTRQLIPENETAFLQMDYERLCSSERRHPLAIGSEIDIDMFNDLIGKKGVDVIDVREALELPAVNDFSNINIPLAQLSTSTSLIGSDTVVVFCQTGTRSLQAAKILSGIFGSNKRIYSLRGGIMQWLKQKQTV